VDFFGIGRQTRISYKISQFSKSRNFLAHIKNIINIFVQGGRANNGKTTGRHPESEKAVED
jgi:hypothetical protein